MGSTYTGTAAHSTGIYLPSDGDDDVVASVNAALEACRDEDLSLRAGEIDSVAVTRMVNMALAVEDGTVGGSWLPKMNSGSKGWVATTTAAGFLWIPLDVPDGATITAITAYVKAAGGHGVLPTMPVIEFFSFAPATGVSTGIHTTADASASVVAYEALHTIAMTGLSEVVDRSAKYYMVGQTNEQGGSAIAGLTLYGISVTFTTAQRDPGAS